VTITATQSFELTPAAKRQPEASLAPESARSSVWAISLASCEERKRCSYDGLAGPCWRETRPVVGPSRVAQTLCYRVVPVARSHLPDSIGLIKPRVLVPVMFAGAVLAQHGQR
jgi:hypothetical protein